ncbi:MAG: RadC family protein [Bacilli bacterium]|jgi:DNA repair protein RadC
MKSIKLKELPLDEQPREKLLKYGVENVSTSDLIAIILKTGTKKDNVFSLAQKVLIEVEEIDNLKDISLASLTKIPGIGQVKALQLIASIELGRRVYYEKKLDSKLILTNPKIIYDYIKYFLQDKKQEHFYVLYLDNKHRLIEKRLLFVGTINISVVHPREIFKYAYLFSAAGIICVHNHPSGNPEASKEDQILTQKLREIGTLLGIKLIDHLIIGQEEYYSFYENNKL